MKLLDLKKSVLAGLILSAILFSPGAVSAYSFTAVQLPASSRMFSIGCGVGNSIPSGQLFGVNPTDGASDKVGTGTPIYVDDEGKVSNCARQPAWDASTKTAYYIAWGDPTVVLAKMDLLTGVSAKVGVFSNSTSMIFSMAIDANGRAYAIDEDANLYSVNLSTAALTPVASIAQATNSIFGFAFSPDGNFYVIETGGKISSLNVQTGSLSHVGDFLANGAPTNSRSLQIDSTGAFWVQNTVGSATDLYTINPGDISNTTQLISTLKYSDAEYNTDALLVAPRYAPVIISAPPSALLKSGTPVSFAILATSLEPVTFTVTGSLPAGLAINASTGIIAGTPTQIGTFVYTVTVTNGIGTDAATYTQTVTGLPHVAG
jgi:hypothetical protein